MAEGAWVPVFDSIWTHQKTARLARELRVTPEIAAAKLLRLYAWARDRVESGDLGTVQDRSLIAEAVGLPKRRGEELYAALATAELITSDGQGHISGWEDGPGMLVRSRREDRMRKQHERAGHPRPVDDCPKCRRAGPESAARKGGKSVETAAVSGGKSVDSHSPSAGHGATLHRVSAGQMEDDPRPDWSKARQDLSLSVGRPKDAAPLSERTDRQTDRYTPTPTPSGGHGDARGEAEAIVTTAEPALWGAALAILRTRMTASQVVTWFRASTLEERGDGYVVRVANAFTVEWLRGHCAATIREALTSARGASFDELVIACAGERLPETAIEVDDEPGIGPAVAAS